jgi:hypothetical protein
MSLTAITLKIQYDKSKKEIMRQKRVESRRMRRKIMAVGTGE